MKNDEYFMKEAIKLAKGVVEHGNEPFERCLSK